jgi:phosphoglycolate phosphatase
MVHAAMRESGAAATQTYVIGDTAFDMAMAVNAGAHAIGVCWGYHDAAMLTEAGAARLVQTPTELRDMLAEIGQ